MDHGGLLVCQTEPRRLLWLFGLILAVVLTFQHFEFPYGSALSSLLSSGKVSFQEIRSLPAGDNSELSGNATLLNGLTSTSTHTIHNTRNITGVSDLEKETNGVNEGKDRGTRTDVAPERKRSPSGALGPVNEGNSQENREEQHNNAGLVKFKNSENGMALEKSGEHKTSISSNNPSAAATRNFNTDTSFVHKDVRDKLTKDEKSGMLQSNSSLSNYSSMVNQSSGMPISEVLSISKMNALLLQSHASPHSREPLWSAPVDQELLYAKQQIENAPNVKNDTELYPPLYQNVSRFKRSYELMENMLKVYIYKEGEKPIFHESILEGIYSSEGWFIKLMEASHHFVTEDPGRAHLFYIPFSSRLLQLTIYVPNSHNRSNLIQYMKDHVEMLAAKYHFWNRTGGADHFVAACHDWAPAETRGRMTSCLRALCNADIKTGFDIGKDVSLPTTYVRSAENPLKGIGGEPPSRRTVLAFFAGYMHGPARPVLLEYWGNKDPDMKIFSRLPPVRGNKNYIHLMRSSRYCICARGYAVHSPRVVESIFYECVPVIISDNYVPPFFEVLNWESFAVFVLEKDIPNLKNILLSITEEKYLEMQKRVKMVQQHFLWHAEPVKYDLFHMILHSVWYNRIFQIRHT
ncbi:probable glycosyltransferase At5g03795 [Diospyros lotus]|uniref:probable glycosyltransferase At5g03795 n=1 Tax=Diospyros lotus TaxID=55363 RepID=UPI0022526A44|nr:probable glycosyltransferase At5g03795 [Diospyros lotus]XP_052208797.1 probable glycosyltransferase At5g03795 [Diospyros lotus]XP_052208798.1 probable glycosyltransferase At5g03795 [Diospyros lotus]